MCSRQIMEHSDDRPRAALLLRCSLIMLVELSTGWLVSVEVRAHACIRAGISLKRQTLV